MGSLDAKLAWAKAAGAVGAFTWIHPGRSRDFTRRSGVAHHWLPFAFDPAVFARHATKAARVPQPIDVGFTGASGLDKYPQRAAVLQTIRESAPHSHHSANRHALPSPLYCDARAVHAYCAHPRCRPPGGDAPARRCRPPEAAPASAPQ